MDKIIHKAYKFRLYPTVKQKILLAKHFGSCRFLFNYFLNIRKEQYLKDKTSLSYYDNSKALTVLKKEIEYAWLKEVNSQALVDSLRNLDTAYKKFFNKQNKFPTFKSKLGPQSFTIPQNIILQDTKLSMPKFREGIKLIGHRTRVGRICFATVSKTHTNKYYVSITCETEYTPLCTRTKSVGIDTGIKELAILSDGTAYANIKILKKTLKKLKYKQRQLSKKVKGSNSRQKQKLKVALCHEKITNTRKDYLHKVSTEIVKNHDIIVVEDLAVKNLMKNHKLAQAFADVSLGELYRQLEYKANWNNRQYVKIDRWFPSSKICSECGWIYQDLTLKIRTWECPKCNTEHDRDINAAKNILTQGLNILSGCGAQSDTKQKQVEALYSKGKSRKPNKFISNNKVTTGVA